MRNLRRPSADNVTVEGRRPSIFRDAIGTEFHPTGKFRHRGYRAGLFRDFVRRARHPFEDQDGHGRQVKDDQLNSGSTSFGDTPASGSLQMYFL